MSVPQLERVARKHHACCVLSSRHARRATGLGVLLATMVLITGVFAGQARGQAASTVPDTDQTLAALAQVERWVRAWDVPAQPVLDANASTPAVGALVVLRAEGMIVGRGEAQGPALNAPDGDVVRRATAQAMERAFAKLGVANDALREERTRAAASRLSISLELAGDFARVESGAWAEVDRVVSPGLDGVAARIVGEAGRESGKVETVYPSVMLASGAAGSLLVPSRAMAMAAARAIGEGGPAAALESPAKLRAERAVRLYSFRVSHAVQGPMGTTPVVLYRGSRLMPPGAVMTRAELVEMADGLAGFLVRAAGLADGASPGRAIGGADVSQTERALVVLALSRSAAVRTPGGIATTDVVAIGRLVDDGLASTEPAAAAVAACAIDATGPIPSEHVSAIRAALRRALGFQSTGGPGGRPTPLERALALEAFPPALKAVPVWAALRALDDLSGAELGALDGLLRERYADPAASPIAQMPWLGLAELELRDRRRLAEVPAGVALRQMREQLWQHQLSLGDAGPDTLDMVGGIVFTAGVAGGTVAPYPTWHSARPLVFAATMLREPSLTEPGERARETVRLMRALRLLRQLQVDDVSAWAYANAGAAVGGIRAAPWDFGQPVDASAMVLLCVAETIKSLDALAAGQGPEGVPAADKP